MMRDEVRRTSRPIHQIRMRWLASYCRRLPLLITHGALCRRRHRGIAAVEWTIREGDPIAGGTVYHLADRMDAGAIAAQEWCFVKIGETARELWERQLAPLGLKLLGEVVDYAKAHKRLPSKPQDEQFATRAPTVPV